jgi:trk system potassium uptake protein TrkH
LLYYLRDAEVFSFLVIVAGLSALVTALLWLAGEYSNPFTALRYAAFQVISIITTTGFTTASFADWPSFLPALLIYISFIGGCAGSTAGGMKVVRVVLLLKQVLREVEKLVHPRGVISVKLGDRSMGDAVMNAIWGFFVLYVFSTTTLTLLMIGTGMDTLSAYAAVATCLNVTGPGLGEVTSNFATVSPAGKWISVFTMLLGRLEMYTLFVLLMPAFWKQ